MLLLGTFKVIAVADVVIVDLQLLLLLQLLMLLLTTFYYSCNNCAANAVVTDRILAVSIEVIVDIQ